MKYNNKDTQETQDKQEQHKEKQTHGQPVGAMNSAFVVTSAGGQHKPL